MHKDKTKNNAGAVGGDRVHFEMVELYDRINADNMNKPNKFPLVVEAANYHYDFDRMQEIKDKGGYMVIFQDSEFAVAHNFVFKKKDNHFKHIYQVYRISDDKSSSEEWVDFQIKVAADKEQEIKIKDVVMNLGGFQYMLSNAGTDDKFGIGSTRDMILKSLQEFVMVDPLYKTCMKYSISRIAAKNKLVQESAVRQITEKVNQ